MPNQTAAGAIIIAAGTSERMGRQKLSLLFSKNNSFIEHGARQFSLFGCTRIALVVNRAGHDWIVDNGIIFPPEAGVVINGFPEKGRMHSIRLGLRYTGTTHPVFLNNVDNPFINHKILSEMMMVPTGSEGCMVYPQYHGKGGHPVLLSPVLAAKLLQAKEEVSDFRSFLSAYTRLPLEVNDERILANINTEADYLRYFPPQAF